MNLKAIRANNTRAFNKFPHVVEALLDLRIIHQGQTRDEQVLSILKIRDINLDAVKVKNANGEWKLYQSRMLYLNKIHNDKGEILRIIDEMSKGNKFIRSQPYVEFSSKRIEIEKPLAWAMKEFKDQLMKPEANVLNSSNRTDSTGLIAHARVQNKNLERTFLECLADLSCNIHYCIRELISLLPTIVVLSLTVFFFIARFHRNMKVL